MEDRTVIAGLAGKRSELAGQIEHAQIALRRLIADLESIDSALRVFAPEMDLPAIKRKKTPRPHPSYRHDVQRIALETLRTATGPTMTREIAHRVMQSRGLGLEDRAIEKMMVSRVGACLRRLAARGTVKSVLMAGRFTNWELQR